MFSKQCRCANSGAQISVTMRVGVDQLRRDSDALPFLRTQPSGMYRTPSRFAASLSAPSSLPHAGAGLARGLTAPRTTAVRRRQPPLANRVRVAGRNAHRDRSVTQDAPTHAGGVASIRDNIAVDDLYAVAIFRAAAPSSRMNDHAPTAVERIGPGRRSIYDALGPNRRHIAYRRPTERVSCGPLRSCRRRHRFLGTCVMQPRR